jgi:hypothetical protein
VVVQTDLLLFENYLSIAAHFNLIDKKLSFGRSPRLLPHHMSSKLADVNAEKGLIVKALVWSPRELH